MKPNIESVQYSTAVCSRNNSLIEKKERNESSSLQVPYDVLFSNEFLRDLGRLWSLRDIIPDPNNLPWIEKKLSDCEKTLDFEI